MRERGKGDGGMREVIGELGREEKRLESERMEEE